MTSSPTAAAAVPKIGNDAVAPRPAREPAGHERAHQHPEHGRDRHEPRHGRRRAVGHLDVGRHVRDDREQARRRSRSTARSQTRIVRFAKWRSGTSGSATRSSIAMKAASPDDRDERGDDDRRAASPAVRRSPSRRRARSAVTVTPSTSAPAMSNLRPERPAMCGTATTASASAMRPTGMLIQKTQRHPQASVMRPPDERADEDRDGEGGADDRQDPRALARRGRPRR